MNPHKPTEGRHESEYLRTNLQNQRRRPRYHLISSVLRLFLGLSASSGATVEVIATGLGVISAGPGRVYRGGVVAS